MKLEDVLETYINVETYRRCIELKKETYLRQMIQRINDRKVKEGIYSELQDCIDDFIEMYIEQGMTPEEAEAEAVKQMGDPEETGEMFNEVYRLKFEWKMIWYMLVWILIARFIRWVIYFSAGFSPRPEVMNELAIGTTSAGIFLLLVGVGLSYFEKTDDTPFLWIKEYPKKHWAMPGLGVFSNSGSLSGVGIGAMAADMQQLIILFGLVASIFLFQRLYLTSEANKKEQKYIYQECVALEDFIYKGYVLIGEEKHKVQIRHGRPVKAGEHLLIAGAKGFTLIAERW